MPHTIACSAKQLIKSEQTKEMYQEFVQDEQILVPNTDNDIGALWRDARRAGSKHMQFIFNGIELSNCADEADFDDFLAKYLNQDQLKVFKLAYKQEIGSFHLVLLNPVLAQCFSPDPIALRLSTTFDFRFEQGVATIRLTQEDFELEIPTKHIKMSLPGSMTSKWQQQASKGFILQNMMVSNKLLKNLVEQKTYVPTTLKSAIASAEKEEKSNKAKALSYSASPANKERAVSTVNGKSLWDSKSTASIIGHALAFAGLGTAGVGLLCMATGVGMIVGLSLLGSGLAMTGLGAGTIAYGERPSKLPVKQVDARSSLAQVMQGSINNQREGASLLKHTTASYGTNRSSFGNMWSEGTPSDQTDTGIGQDLRQTEPIMLPHPTVEMRN
jgi:hypothetical protein